MVLCEDLNEGFGDGFEGGGVGDQGRARGFESGGNVAVDVGDEGSVVGRGVLV